MMEIRPIMVTDLNHTHGTTKDAITIGLSLEPLGLFQILTDNRKP